MKPTPEQWKKILEKEIVVETPYYKGKTSVMNVIEDYNKYREFQQDEILKALSDQIEIPTK